MRPDLVLFDLDGTLLDHEGSVRRALDVWLPTLAHSVHGPATSRHEHEHEHEHEHDTVIDAWFDAERRHFTAWRDGQITFAEQRRRRLRDVLPLLGLEDVDAATDAELDDIFGGYVSAYEASWHLFPDAEPCLDALRDNGFRVALLTNGSDAQQRAKVRATGLTDAFEGVYTAEALGVAKPQPAAFQAACGALAVAPEDVLYVGDEPAVDVGGALAAGLAALHVDREGTHDFPREQRITTLRELPGRLV